MTPTEIREDLNGWTDVRESGVPSPISEWHFVNSRYVVDGIPYTKPQIEAFLGGLEKGLDWVYKVAEHVETLSQSCQTLCRFPLAEAL